MPSLADQVYSQATQLYIAIKTKNGPHVTPELFTVSDGKFWCMTATSTLKSKILRREGQVGLLAVAGDEAVVARGSATVVDPARPLEAAVRPTSTARAMIGATKFVAENALELTGAVVAALKGKLGDPLLPPPRVLIGMSAEAGVVLLGDAVAEEWGWEDSGLPLSSEALELDDDDGGLVPDALVRSKRTVLGVLSDEGAPLALPAAWDSDRRTATVSRQLYELVGASASGPTCVTFDTWTGYGPLGKQGIMLRGKGKAQASDDRVEVRVGVERATFWDGIKTRTEPR